MEFDRVKCACGFTHPSWSDLWKITEFHRPLWFA